MTVRVAIVGSGPSGFYTADALLRSGADVEINVIDRLPTPFGLIRAGVAPDHQKTKNVSRAYEKTALNDKVAYYGNVDVGVDMDVGTSHDQAQIILSLKQQRLSDAHKNFGSPL